MAPKVYIDGQAGTTGLVINDILADRSDIELIRLPDDRRKDESVRREAISEADLAILCLPDDAARQASRWAESSSTKVIDASTANRVADGWVYGLPELGGDVRERICESQRVSNPGCYPTSVILLLRPLITENVMPADSPLAIHALSGYSGGGRRLIERWEDADANLSALPYSAPYALERVHKHVPEMMKYSGLQSEPLFLPRVGAFYNGMRVEIPVHASCFGNTVRGVEIVSDLLCQAYEREAFVEVRIAGGDAVDEYELNPGACNGTNRIKLSVYPHPSGHILLVGILDNLAKGASGAAVQSMNLMLGFDEGTGLDRPISTRQ